MVRYRKQETIVSISFSGLASGLDTSSWVESLVSLKQAKIDSYEEEKDVVAQMQDTLASIKSFFTSFRGVIEKVTDAKFGIASMDIFAQNLATSSNLDVLTASVTSEAEEATYNVGVDQLATATDAVSQYTYTTTIVQTSIASLDSKLINLGLNINDTGSQIGVTVNGVEHGIILYENDTIQDLIDKLQNIGVDASYNEDTGVFSMNISDSDINDIDNTNIVDALHLEGVNEGYTSNNLQIEHVETIYSDATESTLLSELGVNAGLLTIDANDQSYTVTIKNNTTIGSFVADLESKHIDVDFTDGVLTLDNAVISNQGTTNFLDALNMQQDVASQTQTSNNLNYQTITTDTSIATEDTLLKDLGEGINFTNRQTIIFKNSNNVYDTITVNQTTTLGDIIAELNNNGLNAQLSQDGILSIQGGEITGGTFDAINLLNLNETPMTAMASGNSLSHTIQFNSVISSNTKIVDEFGAKQGYFLVTDANGNEHYTKIYSGQTFQNLIDTLNSYGISASLSPEGILSVQGGTLESLSDSQVQQLVKNKTIKETNASLIKGSDFVDIVFKNTDFNASEATSDPLTYTLTQTLNASLTTTLAQLGITKNGSIKVDGKNINITTSMSIQSLIDTLANNNIQANWDAQNATLTINAKVQDPNNTNFVNALNLQETVTEYYASSDRIFQAVTNTQQATESTALNQFGITNSLSNAQRTVKFYNANGDLLSQITVTQSSTLNTLISAANKAGLNASLNNGILTIEDGYISNDILQDSLGLEYNPGSSFALGNIITTTELQAATLDSSLKDIIAALGNQSLVASGYTLSFNGTALNVSKNSTINDIINLIQLNGGSASIDSSGRLSISGGTLSGSVANALEITQTITTTKVNATGDKTLMTKQEVFADRSTTLKQLGINNSTMVINKNGAAIKTITVQATNTLGDLFDTLAANGIEASIADGVITLSSLQNLYVSGNLANSLGINTFSNTQTLNTSASSTIAVSYTDTIIADITSKLGDVGAIKNSSDNLLIYDADNNCIATISSLTTQSNIGDMFALLNNYGFSTNIYNGTISIYSDQGLYIKGNIATNLGINATSTGTVYTTLGNAITSSIQISYSQNDNISLEDKLSNVISITGNNVIQVTNQNGNHIAYITVNQNTTFAQLFNSLNNYGINASLSDNYIDLQSNDNNVIKDSSGNVLSQLGISLSSTTVTTTIGMTSSSSSQIKYSQNVSNPADGSTTMAQLGLTGKTLTINQTSGGTVNMTFAANATLDSLFNTLAAYGINASISNGVISIASTNGNYISGTLPTALGISVINGSTSGTIGQSTSSSGALTAHEGESPANTSNTLAEIGITGNQTLVINQTNGSSNVTITVTDSTTLNSIFNTLSTYGINASMSNGIITLDSESGAYISGSLATALGFDVLSFVANKTTGTSMTSNAPITYTSTGNVIATADTTLGELGMKSSGSGTGNGILDIYSSTGTLVTSLNIEPDDTLQDVFNQLAAYGINASINNGIISLTSTNGNYISGSVPELLGIETKQITVNTSHAATSTSTAPITATSTNVVTKDATLEQIGISDEISDGFINPINRMTQQEAVAAGYTWVTSASQLSSYLNNGATSGSPTKIMLGADIDLSGINWNSSGIFQGTFDGNGYTISNLSGTSFMDKTVDATIRNVRFENAKITSSSPSDSHGVVASYDQGNSTFDNIVVDSTSTIVYGYWDDSIKAGGIVSYLAGSSTISNNVSLVSINFNTSSTKYLYIGGIVGINDGTVTNSVFGGKLNSTTYNENYTGGIAGYTSGTLRNNKSYGQIVEASDTCVYIGAIAGFVTSSTTLASNAYYSTGGLDPFGYRTATSTEAFVNPSILGMGLGFGVFTKDGDLLGEVTVSSSTTLDNIISQLSNYGINATLTNGVLSLSSSIGAVVAGNIPEALGIQLNYNSAAAGGGGTSSGPTTTTTGVSQTSYTDIVTYGSLTLNLNISICNLSDDLRDAHNDSYGREATYYLTVSNSGTTTTIAINTGDTLGDLQSEFYRAGMSLTLDGNKVTLSSLPTANAYLVGAATLLLDALKIGAGEGISYTVTTSGGGGGTPDAGPLWSNTDSNTLVGRDLVTTSSSLSDIGVNSTQYITVVQNGTQDVISLDSSASLGDIIDRLSEYGITASLNNQQFTITGNSTGSFVKGMSTSLRNALKLNVGQGYTYNVSSSTQTGNETSGSITTTGTGEVNAKGSTELSELGINSSQYITIKQNGTTQVVTLGSSDSINDLISKLSNYGISASLSNGRIAIEGSEISFVTGMSAGLANALNVTAGKGHSYTISTETVTSNSTTSLQFYTQGASKAVSTSTTLGELGISGTSSMTINQGALGAATVQFTESDTIGDIIEQINLLGGGHLTASLSSNKFNITADGTDYYVSFLSSKLSDALKLGATYKTATVSKPTNSTTSNYLSVTENETITATAATSLSSIGVTSNQYITVRQDGTLRTITVGASDTIGSLISKLAKYGINASISDGFLTVQGSENSSITGISSTLANAIKLSASGSGNSYTVITETTYKNSDSKNLGSIASTKTLNSDTTMSQLGFNSSGNITVVQNGTQYQVAVDGSKTLGDILTALSAYGIAGSIQNGKLTLSPSSNAFILGMTSGVATALALKTGNGNSYSTSSKQTYTNSTSKNLNKNGTNLILNEDTVLNKINGFTKAGNLVIHQDNGSNVTISVAATQTLKDFFNQIAAYGLTGNVDSTGRVTISASGNTYLQAVSGGTNLLSALKLSNPTRSTVSEYDNSDSSQLSYTQTIAAQNSTTLQNLIDSSNNKPTFNGNNITLVVQTTANGTTANNTLVFSKTQTLQDVFNTLQNYGIQAQIDASGKISLTSDSLSNFNLSGNLSSFLLGSYSKQYTTQVTNNQSAILTNTVISAMTDDNTLAELGITNGTVNIFKNGQNAGSFNLNTIKTIGDFRNILEQYGFTTSLDNQGRLSVSSADGSYLTASSSNILTKLGLNDFTILDASQQSSALTQTTVSNPGISLSAAIKDLTNSAGTNLGITNGNVYVYNNGVRNTVYIDNNMTLQELSDKLEQFNINLSLADGKIYLEGIGNSYITTDGLSSASNILDKIGLDNWEYEATSTSKSLSFVQSSDQIITENIKITNLQDKNGNKLNISQGTFNIYQNGVKHTETIDSETTINDLFNMLEKYGINASIASNGAISLSADGNAYIENGSSNIASKLFDDWKFSNTYTSNTLSITQTDTVFIDQNTKLADINEGTFKPGVFTLVNNGVQTNITVNANDTIGTFIDQLQMHGFDTVINENGQLIVQAQGDSYLKNYNGTNASNILDILGLNQNDWINTSTYDSNTLNVIKTNTFDTAATLDTKLSLLGVTTGEYYIYNNGVKYTALISSDETIQSLIDTLHQFGIETSLTGDSSNSILTILGQGDSYIQTSNSATNASNVVDVLFNNSTDTKYQYSSDKQTSEIVTTYSNATEDTLLSYFDTPWGGSTLKAEGQLSVTVNGVDSVINITKDETIGSLLNKFKALGLEATLSDGQIMIQSGYDTFTINSAGTTSSIINPNANFNLKFNDDLGGYLASVDTVMATTTTVEVRTLSVANYADNNTKLGDLNISSGTLSVYRNGQKATIQVDENDTFNQFRAKLASAFSDVDIKFEDGFLQIYSKDGNKIEAGATTDSSNFSAVTGITNQEDGSVKSARALFKVNNESVITNSGLFRNGNVTQGTFTIGNATFTIDNSTTLNDIISQINNNDDANATAYWDNIDGKLVIQSRTTGAAYINIEAGTSNFTDIMGFTSSEWKADGSIKLTRLLADAQDIGQNARFSINGTNYTSTSNTITSDVSRINGLTINLKGLSEGETVTLTIEKDKETVASALQDVVDSYNELMKNVDEAIAANGDLHSETTLKLIRNQLRNMMTSSDIGTTVFRNLDAIGICVDAASANNIDTNNIINLSFDKDKFLEAYEADDEAVKALLVGSENNTGIFNKVEQLLESALTSVSGYFDSADRSFDREIERLDNKIVNATKDMQRYRERLENKFSAMDMLIANMQQQYASFLV